MSSINSFLKWPGGKGRILDKILPHIPANRTLIEPFVGGGNVFINAEANGYIIADNNLDLINTYIWIKKNVKLLITISKKLFNSNIDYYEIRKAFNSETNRTSITQACRFIWLNRHCFNGLCRYNSRGEFNVAIGKHTHIHFPEYQLITYSHFLNEHDVKIQHNDFTSTIKLADKNSVIYCDPPYLTRQNEGFVKYTPSGFGYIETKTLENDLCNAVVKGAIAVVSNSDNDLVREIFKQFKIYKVSAPRLIACNGQRNNANEIIAVLTPDCIEN